MSEEARPPAPSPSPSPTVVIPTSLPGAIGAPLGLLLAALRGTSGGLMALALLVGAGAGLGAVAFRWLIKTFTLLLEHALGGGYVLLFLLMLLVGKMVATSLTIGIGGSGGVFAPSLFIGAMLGMAFGQGAHQLLPGIAGPAGAYGLIGMGAVFAGAARAPITAVVILFELTGEYSIILPLMSAIVLATIVSRALSKETIYTAKLRRRGVDLDAPAAACG